MRQTATHLLVRLGDWSERSVPLLAVVEVERSTRTYRERCTFIPKLSPPHKFVSWKKKSYRLCTGNVT